MRAARLALLALALAGCDRGADRRGVTVSVIGAPPPARPADPNRSPLSAVDEALLMATAHSLVSLDAAGLVEAGVAGRWILSDDGLSYVFNVGDARWADGTPVKPGEVVRALRDARARASRNPLKPVLGAIAAAEAMNDEVLEIRLVSPRPEFLQLLAQPELALIRRGRGTGPLVAGPAADGVFRLTRRPPPDAAEDVPPGETPAISLRGERAALALARFRAGGADLVLGGDLGQLPTLRVARPPANAVRFDPAAGLFGLAVADARGALAAPELRRAVAMAIDREAIVRTLGTPGIAPRTALLPLGIEGVAAPAEPDWAALPFPARVEEALRLVREAAGDAGSVPVRVAMPDAPGHRLLFALIRRDLARVGVDARRVPPAAPADLRLLDAVAPASLASWYLRWFECGRSALCDSRADEALARARAAQTGAERALAFAEADRLLVDATVFVALATPVRWSLVRPGLEGFSPNIYARHPLPPLLPEE